MKLTSDQKIAYDTMMARKNVFLTGEAGTGKSFVINQFLTAMEEAGKNILVCAPTGIAAINVGGVTIHRSFQAKPEPQISKRINHVPDVVKKADIIIIDEISMCRVDLFDFVARTISKAEEACLKRKQVVVVGDFFQLPPVTVSEDYKVLKEIYPDYDKGFAFESENWQDFDFQKIELKQIMRQDDEVFISELNKARVGNQSCVNFFNRKAGSSRQENGIILCATNKVVDKINREELDKIDSPEKVYQAIINGEVKAGDKPTSDKIHLKLGARVIILINDTEGDTYQNGSLGEVVKMSDGMVQVRLDSNNQIVMIGYHEWAIENYGIESEVVDGVTFQRLKKRKIGSFIQMPLRLAYAITIHKSQGQTYDRVNLLPHCFDCGQLYVALSRVKSLSGLSLLQRMRQEDLICSEKVKRFYGLTDYDKLMRQRRLLAAFGNDVFKMDKRIRQQFPLELKQLMQAYYQRIKENEKS